MDLTALILFGGFAVMLLIGVPIALALGAATAVTLFYIDMPVAVVGQRIFTALDSSSIMAIPFFVLAGNLMTQGGISRRIVDLANALVGGVRGGLFYVMIISCAFFAALSGSAPATVIAIGAMLYPEMIKRGYPEQRSAGLLAVAGGLGPIIPPSIIMVVYGTITSSSIGDLFKGGLVAGLMIAVVLAVVCVILSSKENWPKSDTRLSFGEFMKALYKAFLAVMLPVIVLGGIYSGIFTPTESAVVAVFYGLLVCMAIYRELSGKDTWEIIKMSSVTTANIMFLVVTAQMFGYLLTYYRIPVYVTEAFMSVAANGAVFMMLIVLLLTLCGMFIEVGATNLILGPILAPIAIQFGIDPVHFGLVFVFLLAMGQATPPFGTTLFVACGLSGESVAKVSKMVLPFVLVELACAVLFAYVPVLSTGISDLMK